MTPKKFHRTAIAAALIVLATSSIALSAHAADEPSNKSSGEFHPVDETKKAGKAVGHGVKKTATVIGHGFRDGARAIGHGTRKVTRDIGHAFRDGAHKVTGKKD